MFSPSSWIWSLISSIKVFVLGFLFVSFRSALLRSHSCSTGDSLDCSLGMSAWLSITFVTSVLALHYLAFCFFLSLALVSISQWFPQYLFSAFASNFPQYFTPNFLCAISWFWYLASVCFLSSYPASLPQPLHRWFPLIALGDILRTFNFKYHSASDYSDFCTFFSLLPKLSRQRFVWCIFPLHK